MKKSSVSKRAALSLAAVGLVAPVAVPAFAGAAEPGNTLTTTFTTGVALPSGTQAGHFGRSDLAVASDGTTYVTDPNGNQILKITPAGEVTVFAGTGTSGFSGEGTQASTANLHHPTGITIDPDGNVVFADTYNHRIRSITPGGVITTIAGVGGNGTNGGSDYDEDTVNAEGDGGVATAAELNNPSDVAFLNDGSFYISDTNNSRIRFVGTDGNISRAAGGHNFGVGSDDASNPLEATFTTPMGIALDGTTLYIADPGSHLVRKLDAGGVSTVAGSTPAGPDDTKSGVAVATDYNLNKPTDVAIVGTQGVAVTDYSNERVHLVAFEDGVITTIAGTGGSGNATTTGAASKLDRPTGITTDSAGSVYFLDQSIADPAEVTRLLKLTAESAAPTITISAGLEGNSFYRNSNLAASFGCSDAGSGIESCTATIGGVAIVDGAKLPTSAAGSSDLVVTATDNLGNVATKTVSVTILATDIREIRGTHAGSDGTQAAVARLYMAIMDRQPEDGGHAYWMSEVNSGRSLSSVASFFIVSPEFQGLYGDTTDSEFVDLMYENVMKRDPAGDPTGRAFWNDYLDTHTRLDMTLYFSQSEEFKGHTKTS